MADKENKSIAVATQGEMPNSESGLKRGLGALKSTIEDLTRSLREIQGPLNDTRDCLPKATTHLDRISSQTEQATHKVLDMVENISNQQVEIIDHLNKALNVLADTGKENIAVSELLEKAEEVANRSQNDAFAIMDALQFQDITTQQINHAASLLEEVDAKIAEIFGDIDETMGIESAKKDADSDKKRKVRSFDPHADMVFKHTDQSGIDNLVRENNGAKDS